MNNSIKQFFKEFKTTIIIMFIVFFASMSLTIGISLSFVDSALVIGQQETVATTPKYTMKFNYTSYKKSNGTRSNTATGSNVTSCSAKIGQYNTLTFNFYIWGSVSSGTGVLANGGRISSNVINISTSYSGSFVIKNSSGNTVSTKSSASSTGALSLSDGTYNVTYNCQGTWLVGRLFYEEGIDISFSFVVDTTAPTITLSGGVTSSGGSTTYGNSVKVTTSDGTLTYSKNNGAATSFSSGTSFTEPGTYVITASDGLNTSTKSFTINKASITIPSSPSAKTYTGSSQSCGITTPSNTTAGGTTSATKAGEYTATYSLNNTSYYQWSDGTTTNKSVKWKINPYTLTTSMATLSTTSVTYNGSAQSPSATVKYNSTTLTSGTDYTISYTNNTNAGTATATITGKGNFTGTISKTFTINQFNISSGGISNISAYTYDGNAKKPTITLKVTLNGTSTTLTSGTNYTLSYSNNTNAGTATVTATGTGNFTGSLSKNFTINKASITIPSSPADKTYNGSSQNCGITTPSNTTASGTTSATNAGEYTATYSLNSTNYQWSDGTTTNKNVKWKINKASITIPSSPADKTYNGSSQSCGITTPSNTTASGTTSATNVGEYTATYSLNSTNYQWSNGTTSNKDVKWKIKAYTMVASMVSMSPTSYAYNGSSQKATAVVKFNSKTLTKDTDYTVAYPSDTTNIGTITVAITGKGNFTGSVNATYKIETGYVDTPNAPSTFTYNGAEQTYEPTNWGSISSLCNISNNKRTVAGFQTVTISLKNKTGYKWSDNTNEDRTYKFTIDKFNISSGLFTEVSSQTYNGSAICPTTQLFVSLKNGSTQLVKDTDYTLSYTNNTNAGTATITATGKGNFTGTKSINFVINKRTITEPVKNTTLFMYNAENQYYYPANWTAISDYCNITNNVMSAVGSKVVTVSLKDKSNNKWTDGSDTDKTFDFVMKDYWISYKTSTLSGSGTEEEPYKILCEEDLACLASMVNNDELSDYTYVVLMKNLNLTGKQWTPIGNYLENHYFNGSFDGNYHAIKNMKVEDYSVAGLFGGIAGVSTTAKAEIKNLILEKSTIDIVSENECYAGTITAYGQNLDIKNSNIFGNVSVNGSACVAGGFIGQSKNIMVSNCSIIGNVSSTSSETSFVGGYIGKSEGELIVSQSYIQGNVLSSNGYTGGIFGYTIVGDDIVISECFTEGNITGTYTGGIAGYYLFNMINQSITNVYTSNEKIVGAGGNTIKITNYYTSTKYSGEFSSDYWFISSDINGGLPTLKGIYWIGAGYSNSSSEIISVLQSHGLTAA